MPPEASDVTVLVIDDTPTNLKLLGDVLSDAGYKVLFKKDGRSGLKLARKRRPDVILLDIMMPEIDGYETCQELKADALTRSIPVIFMSALSDTIDKVKGFEVGAVDYITKPFQVEEVRARIDTHLTIQRLRMELETRNAELNEKLSLAQALMDQAQQRLPKVLIGASEAVQKLRQDIQRMAPSAAPLLLVSPGGVGEEQVARAIHTDSPRSFQPFIRIDCLHVGEDDFESLFGDPQGPLGKWQLAGQGTLFFDLIEALPAKLQEELARRLTEQNQRAQYRPCVIVHCHSDISDKGSSVRVADGLKMHWRRFRIPSLSQRRDDLPALALGFLLSRAQQLGRQVDYIHPDSLARILTHDWPGNLLELSNVLDSALLSAKSPVIEIDQHMLAQRHVGNYELIEILASGGMGEVWRARHRLLVQPAAVKLIKGRYLEKSSNNVALARFEREAQTTALLTSNNTVRLFDYGLTDDGSLYYVMELLDGMDISSLVKTYGAQPPERAVAVMIQACGSLAEAHAAGLIHRDIKPANMILCRMGVDHDILKILDFGLVRSTHKDSVEITQERAIVGTPMFISPEGALGKELDLRADVYSLALVFYFMVTGKRMFDDTNAMAIMVGHITKPPHKPSENSPFDIAPELDDLILRCLAKDPNDRPKDMIALRHELRALSFDKPWTAQRADAWWANKGTEVLAADQSTVTFEALGEETQDQ